MRPFLIVFGMLASMALAQPRPDEAQTAANQPQLVDNFSEINPDGTYKFGYKATDGSFKTESKDTNGVVTGKYGYLDGTGQIKVVEYTSQNGTGFTLLGDEDETPSPNPNGPPAVPVSPIPQFNPLPAVPSGAPTVPQPIQAPPAPSTPFPSAGPTGNLPQGQFPGHPQAQGHFPGHPQSQGQFPGPPQTPGQFQQALPSFRQGHFPRHQQPQGQFQQAPPNFRQGPPVAQSPAVTSEGAAAPRTQLPPLELTQEQQDFLSRQSQQIAAFQDQIAQARERGAEFQLPAHFPARGGAQPGPNAPQVQSTNPQGQQQLFTREQVEQLLAQQRGVQNQAGVPPQFAQPSQFQTNPASFPRPQAPGSGAAPKRPVFNALTFNPNLPIRSQFNSDN